MKKKYILATLLLSPFFLAQTAWAEENSPETAVEIARPAERTEQENSQQNEMEPLDIANHGQGQEETTSSLSDEGQTLATAQDLADFTGKELGEKDGQATISRQEALSSLLNWAATSPKQVGKTEEDRVQFAKSLGMIEDELDLSSPTTSSELAVMQENSQKLYDAYRAEKKQPLFLNGKAQPIFPFSTGAKSEGYDYDKSSIVRHVVYVETDYDTDGDGKRDLVKALVQVPKAAVNGDYKAATIFQALPYITGTTGASKLEDLGLTGGGTFDLDSLYNQPEKRQPKATITTEEAARQATSSSWHYQNPWEGNKWDYEDLNWYNYFLVRGFAVVSSAGLGSYDSQGFNTVGSDLEVAAFKAILEWLDGKRVAYTDKTSNIAVKADWANGKVGMTGLSWGGTTSFALAGTGIENLKTVVPQAGIASWYEYINSQGSPYNVAPNSNLSWLSTYVSGRILDQEDWDSIKDKYAAYITQLDKVQNTYKFDYSPVWANRDYTLHPEKIKIPALIVHGLNDEIVKTKNFELMYQTFKKAGQMAKIYLHQGTHIEPTDIVSTDGDGKHPRPFFDLLNEWFSHYLYDVDNQVEKLPAVLAQNNYDPNKWTSYDSWESKNHLTLTTDSPQDEQARITSAYVKEAEIDWRYRDKAVSHSSSPANLTYTFEVPENLTIKGSIPVEFKAALASGQGDNLPVNVLLVDVADEDFEAVSQNIDYEAYGYRYTWQTIDTLDEKGFWQGSNLKSKPLKQYATLKNNFKVIANGWVNLRNPESGFSSASSAKSIDPQIGEFHDYTVYLQPTVYEVKKGHRLALVMNTYDTNSIYIPDDYEVTFKTASIKASIPILEESRKEKAIYTPSLGKEPAKMTIPSSDIPSFEQAEFGINKPNFHNHSFGDEVLTVDKPEFGIKNPNFHQHSFGDENLVVDKPEFDLSQLDSQQHDRENKNLVADPSKSLTQKTHTQLTTQQIPTNSELLMMNSKRSSTLAPEKKEEGNKLLPQTGQKSSLLSLLGLLSLFGISLSKKKNKS